MSSLVSWLHRDQFPLVSVAARDSELVSNEDRQTLVVDKIALGFPSELARAWDGLGISTDYQ